MFTSVFNALGREKWMNWQRWCLLWLLLLAFGRVVWRLDANDMWWDESLSLQRAESNWLSLLRGDLVMYDGFSELPTTDQHPFFFFVILGIFVRLAGTSEFVLRLPSAMAAVALAPVAWVLAKRLFCTDDFNLALVIKKPVNQMKSPFCTAPLWTAVLVAINPYLLWFGQEARPYTLWAMLALLSTYLLLRYVQTPRLPLGRFALYFVVLAMFLSTHYYAIFWLPLHALILYDGYARRSRWLGLMAAIGLLAMGAIVSGLIAWLILSQGGGGNFPEVTPSMLAEDLLNAFSMGLSVDLNDVRWLDWVFGAVALVGVVWSLRSRQARVAGGWVLPVALIVPIVLILTINEFQPAYMNSRHLALLCGAYLLLVGAGLDALWRFQRWLAGAVAMLMVAGALYSTINYFTLPQYGKDDYTGMGEFLSENLLPGDLLLLNPPFNWRIYNYYLPIAQIDAAAAAGVEIAQYGAPLLADNWPGTYQKLEESLHQYRRVWLARSGTHPFLDPKGEVNKWLFDHAARHLLERKFFSPNAFLDLELFLTQPPIWEGLEPPAAQRVHVQFGDQLQLVGYDIGVPYTPGGALPVTLYWQVTSRPQEKYKYILQLVAPQADGSLQLLAQTEQEPYYGQISTDLWDPGKTIIEYTSLPPVDLSDPGQKMHPYQLTFQMYHAESLEKLPIIQSQGVQVEADAQRVFMPYP